jgi:hypothetical protein
MASTSLMFIPRFVSLSARKALGEPTYSHEFDGTMCTIVQVYFSLGIV